MDLDQDPLRGTETDTLGLAGKVASAAFGFLWKGSLAVLATAVVMGGFGPSSGPSASFDSSRSEWISIDEEDNGFVYFSLRRDDNDRPSHLVFRNPAGRVIAKLTYNHLTELLDSSYVEIGAARISSFVRRDHGVSTTTYTSRVRTEFDIGPDDSVGLRAWHAQADGPELGRLWIPPQPAQPPAPVLPAPPPERRSTMMEIGTLR